MCTHIFPYKSSFLLLLVGFILLANSPTRFSCFVSYFSTQDGSTELGYPEFVQFVGVVKSLEDVCRNDPQMRDKYFPPPASATALSPAKPSPAKPSRRASVHVALAELLRRSGSEAGGSAEGALHRVQAWNRVVAHLNEDALTGAWDMVRAVRG
jgi:hypothetical protein